MEEVLEDIRRLAPCYVYDEDEMRASCAELGRALPGFGLLYSLKANPFPPVVRVMASCGLGADAASAREVALARECGITPEDTYYSAPGKTRADVEAALGGCTIIADSLGELRLIQEVAEGRGVMAEVGIRINPLAGMDGRPAGPSKFGIDEELAGELGGVLRACPNLRARGVHVHVRSQVLDGGMIAAYYERTMRAALEVCGRAGFEPGFVNFGSGVGVAYAEGQEPVDLALLREGAGRVARLNEGVGARLLVETGRYVACRAGRLYAPVVDRKESRGRTYLVVAASMGSFLRPAVARLVAGASGGNSIPAMEPLYTCAGECPVRVVGRSGAEETVTVVGPYCSSLDVIAEEVPLPRAGVGDLVEVGNAGSYGRTLSPSAFSGMPEVRELLRTHEGTLVEG